MTGALALLVLAGCDLRSGAAQASDVRAHAEADSGGDIKTPAPSGPVADAPLAAFRLELLEIAFDAASKFPLEPHIKNRGRAQEEVVTACFKLDQPLRAVSYVEKIVDWRRGSGYADFAFYCAQHGDTSQVQRYFDLAAKVSLGEEDWRRDQIRSKIAMTHAWLGQNDLAAQFESGLVESESGRVAGARAMIVIDDQYDGQVSALDQLIASGNFDLIKGALEAFTQLYNRFYDNQARRASIEHKIKSSWSKMPYLIRVDLLLAMADFAVKHDDNAKALELIDEAQGVQAGFQWDAEVRVPLNARLAELRARAGDLENARVQANLALTMFGTEREGIVDIYRGRALRPLAEAYLALGDTTNALIVYRMAVEEGVENPNSRPRANDLTATCCSMAVCGVEPDAELWARIRQIREGLGDPW